MNVFYAILFLVHFDETTCARVGRVVGRDIIVFCQAIYGFDATYSLLLGGHEDWGVEIGHELSNNFRGGLDVVNYHGVKASVAVWNAAVLLVYGNVPVVQLVYEEVWNTIGILFNFNCYGVNTVRGAIRGLHHVTDVFVGFCAFALIEEIVCGQVLCVVEIVVVYFRGAALGGLTGAVSDLYVQTVFLLRGCVSVV